MGKYIGQREICKRLKTENHQLPKLNDMIYTKYEGTEWLDDRYIHITCQRGGDWLMITYKNEKKTDLYVGYDGHKYVYQWSTRRGTFTNPNPREIRSYGA